MSAGHARGHDSPIEDVVDQLHQGQSRRLVPCCRSSEIGTQQDLPIFGRVGEDIGHGGEVHIGIGHEGGLPVDEPDLLAIEQDVAGVQVIVAGHLGRRILSIDRDQIAIEIAQGFKDRGLEEPRPHQTIEQALHSVQIVHQNRKARGLMQLVQAGSEQAHQVLPRACKLGGQGPGRDEVHDHHPVIRVRMEHPGGQAMAGRRLHGPVPDRGRDHVVLRTVQTQDAIRTIDRDAEDLGTGQPAGQGGNLVGGWAIKGRQHGAGNGGLTMVGDEGDHGGLLRTRVLPGY